MILIDYDILVYRCGFAAQKGTQKEGNLVAEPLKETLESVEHTVNAIVSACKGPGSYFGYLTGGGNFRDRIATIRPYKGNRIGLEKPVWYSEIRSFLVEQMNGEIIDGMEADDKLAIEFYKNPANSVICTIDKDFNQLPGVTIYNWVKKEIYTVPSQVAHRNYWLQVLTGDTTDNIVGIPGIGTKKAEKLLPRNGDKTLFYDICLSEYKNHYKEDGLTNFIENCKLLYLLRKEDDSWEKYVRKFNQHPSTDLDLNGKLPKTAKTEESSSLTKGLNSPTLSQNKCTPTTQTSS